MSEAVGGLTSREVPAMRYDAANERKFEAAGLIASLVPDGARVLDIGCGTGAVSAYLARTRNVEIVGIEPNDERATSARRRGLNVHTGIYETGLASNLGKFDVVLFADVIEHLVDPAEMLLSVKQSLKPSGSVIVSIPNVAHWTVRARLLVGNFDYQPMGIMDATHLRWFTRKSLRRLFEFSGFEISDFTHTAGSYMPIYDKTPLRWASPDAKAALLWQLGKFSPGLFGAQHVVRASAIQPLVMAPAR